ncbi:MAG: hypothetical protein H0X71_07930 [Rubrobacter sp.]|nr:hypothetical protein [Rubrobacter sp.]
MTFHHQRRLDRALHHLESLKAEIAAWVEEGPYRTWTEPDVDSTKKVLWVEVLDTPPSELSLIVGDCLHNLRCALDNLALELAIARNEGPVSSNVERDSGFPIQVEQDANKLDSMLGGIDPLAKAEIERLQPYTRGERLAKTDPLWWLNKLNNMDKHRLPHLVFFTPRLLSFTAPGDYDTVNDIELMRWGPVERRAKIARYAALDETGAEVDVYLDAKFSVSFGKRAPEGVPGLPVPQVLGDIHRRIVRKVLPPLKDFLT